MQQTSQKSAQQAAPPESALIPRGSIESFRRALERLGPFKHETDDEAQRLGPRNEMGFVPSRQLAKKRIKALARNYNALIYIDARAPRTKSVVQDLIGLADCARQFAQRLEALSPMTPFYLQTAGTGVAHPTPRTRIPLTNDNNASVENDDVVQHLIDVLNGSSQYFEQCLANFCIRKEIDPAHPDKGGNTDLWKQMAGLPDWGLAVEGWHLYDLFKPGEASGTQEGPFHLFLLDVYEFATGTEPAGTKLESHVKQVVKPYRRVKEIVGRESALRTELDDLEEQHIRAADTPRTAEIAAELQALGRERLGLWPSLLPHNYRSAAR